MNKDEYSQMMSEFGKKGGIAKAKKYKESYERKMFLISKLFVYCDFLTQERIASKVNCSQSFVSKNAQYLLKEKYKLDDRKKIKEEDFDDFWNSINSEYYKKISKKITNSLKSKIKPDKPNKI